MCCTGQGSQFRTVPVGTAGIYRTGPCISTDTPLVSYRKKYRPYQPHTYFQKLATSVLDQIETSLILPHEKKPWLTQIVNPIVQISGNFAPVQHDLEVVGQVPSCRRGVYLRNGANPQYTPSGPGDHHLFDGDGMIHAVINGEEMK